MLSEMHNLRKNLPLKGLAIHGTSYGKALEIRAKGLNQAHQGALPYFCPIPERKALLKQYPPSEILHRLIGSIIYAASYTNKKRNALNPSAKSKDLPAIVIFHPRNKDRYFDYFSEGYGLDVRIFRGSNFRRYLTFGKEVGKLPANFVRRIVRITKKEQIEILEKSRENSLQGANLLQDLLIKKHLQY